MINMMKFIMKNKPNLISVKYDEIYDKKEPAVLFRWEDYFTLLIHNTSYT